MFKIIITMLVGLLATAVYAQNESGDGVQIRLVAELDEPEFYCFDLAGWGEKLRLDDPLQTHTCKLKGAADQMLSLQDGQIKVEGYDRCIEVAGSTPVTLPGSAVLARECNADTALQKLSLNDNGQIQLADTDYCLVAGTESREASGPSHVWRTLAVGSCDTDESLSTWQVGLD